MNIFDKVSKIYWEKIKKIEQLFSMKNVLVAFSGGIDSSLILYFSKLFAKNTIAVTIKAPTTPSIEIINAKNFCNKYEIPLEILELNSLKIEEIGQNSELRCYYCKKEILSQLLTIPDKFNYDCKIDLFVEGTNFSDLSSDRPGLKALKESSFRSPLAKFELSKDDVINITKNLNLPSQNIPSQACLASRIPFNISLTEERLLMIDRSENAIRKITKDNNSSLRVRYHLLNPSNKPLARIEVSKNLFDTITNNEIIQDSIKTELKQIGFTFVTIDLERFRSGSMHEELLSSVK